MASRGQEESLESVVDRSADAQLEEKERRIGELEGELKGMEIEWEKAVKKEVEKAVA